MDMTFGLGFVEFFMFVVKEQNVLSAFL